MPMRCLTAQPANPHQTIARRFRRYALYGLTRLEGQVRGAESSDTSLRILRFLPVLPTLPVDPPLLILSLIAGLWRVNQGDLVKNESS